MYSAPEFVMGTQGFAGVWTKDNVSKLVERLTAAGINHYDTALLYPMTDPGASERLLGSIRKDDFVIDTKILYRPEALRRDNMEESIRRSLENLGISKVDTLTKIENKEEPELTTNINVDYHPLCPCSRRIYTHR